MSNELVVIEEGKALAVLSDKAGVEKLIEEVRQRVMSLEGGNLKTASGRKAIKSNAFKATKAKTAINNEHIQPLINQITSKIQPDLDTIQALKDNKKILDAGLDQIRQDVNAEVTAIEDEIKRIEDEKKAAEQAEALRKQIESDHEIGLLMNEKFDREEEESRKAAEEAERILKEEEEKARVQREEQIRKEAEEKAKREAIEREKKLEQEKQEAIEREEQAKRDAIAAEERRKFEAEEAEKKRLADIEAAKQAEIQRQKDEEAKRLAEQAKREADEANRIKVLSEIYNHFISLGLEPEIAEKVTQSLLEESVPHIGKIIF